MWDAVKPLKAHVKDHRSFPEVAPQMLAAASLFLSGVSELDLPIGPVLQAAAELIGVVSTSERIH